jgi:ATP-dependent exoDNAse (exonuclease V) alpha subunit
MSMSRCLRLRVADQLNARVVLSGDRRQHKSVARGDVLTMLERDAGLPVAELSEIKRQKGDYKKVAEMLNSGKIPQAFAMLDSMGWIKEMPYPTAPDGGRYSELATDYLTALEKGKSALVVVPTHVEGDKVTAAIRDRLTADKRLTDERTVRRLRPLNFTKPELELAKKNPEEGVLYTRYGAYREETQALALGDQLRATAGFKDLAGRDIDSGTRMTLTGWTEAGNLRVKTASGAERVLRADTGHVTAGYVSTSQGGQGKTVDEVMLWAPSSTLGAVKMDTAYTTGTRGKERLTIYTDNKAELLEAAQREDRRMLASDLVRRHTHKRYLGWLRSLAQRMTKQHERDKDYGYAR